MMAKKIYTCKICGSKDFIVLARPESSPEKVAVIDNAMDT